MQWLEEKQGGLIEKLIKVFNMGQLSAVHVILRDICGFCRFSGHSNRYQLGQVGLLLCTKILGQSIQYKVLVN